MTILLFLVQHNGTDGITTIDWGEIPTSIIMVLIIEVTMDVITQTSITDNSATIIAVIDGTQISIIISDPGDYIFSKAIH